ncbi:hypothetical protein LBMAG53_00470 [Planctomycetota bacterium]|nr:hypothetical protein LBMAG53_00470 [Planctomycetota bacterium]
MATSTVPLFPSVTLDEALIKPMKSAAALGAARNASMTKSSVAPRMAGETHAIPLRTMAWAEEACAWVGI